MRVDILALFPDMFKGPFDESIINRAKKQGLVKINIHNIRDYAIDRHKTVDDYSFGGGHGMVMKPDPIFTAVEALKLQDKADEPVEEANSPLVILLSPRGKLLTQAMLKNLAERSWLVLICGHYEGVDERVSEYLITEEISIGDYVLTGGEPAAIVFVDALVRLIPGVLNSAVALEEESHAMGLLEYPQYTRPAVFRSWAVPDVLLSGNHEAVAKWRRQQALLKTLKQRPDLLNKIELTEEDKKWLAQLGYLPTERVKIDC